MGLAALCSLIVLIVWAARRETAVEKQIHHALAEMRSSGEPISAQDLARLFPNPQAKDDAGVLFSNALPFARKNPAPGSTPIVMGGDPTPARTEPLGEPVGHGGSAGSPARRTR